MPGPIFREGDRVTLHPVEEGDLEFLQETLNHPEVRPGIAATDPINLEQERDWFESFVEDDSVQFLVCADGERAGTIGLTDVNERSGNAEVGYFYHPDYWGNGYATDALGEVVDFAFGQRRLHKVYARAFAFNDASRRVLEKVGFEQEGLFREQTFADGEYVDVYRYGLLADER